MEKIVDYLAEEEAKLETTKTRKNGKKARVAKMLEKLTNVPTPIPVLDFLGD
jgi:hypothetical protein